jgi:H+-transporting ATPase
MVLDIVKVLLIRNWSFELTAKLWPSPKNVKKLKDRQERATILKRVETNFNKLKKSFLVAIAATKFAEPVIRRRNSFLQEDIDDMDMNETSKTQDTNPETVILNTSKNSEFQDNEKMQD